MTKALGREVTDSPTRVSRRHRRPIARFRRRVLGVLAAVVTLLVATVGIVSAPAAHATADTFVGVQSPAIKTASGTTIVVHFGILGYGNTNTLCLDAGAASPNSIRTTGSKLVENPSVAYLIYEHIGTTDRYLAAALSWYVREHAPDSHWSDAQEAMGAIKSHDPGDYTKIMAAYASMNTAATVSAGAYAVTPYLVGAGNPMQGSVNDIGVKSGSGAWISGVSVTVSLTGAATFADGSVTKSGTTTNGPLSWAWNGNGGAGNVSATVQVSGLPPTQYRLYSPAVNGNQRLATSGPLTGVSQVATGAGLVPVTPARLLDTRQSRKPAARSTTTLTVTGHGDIPASGVAAVVLNVTVTSPVDAGFVTVWPSGSPRPTASNLNYAKGQVVANQVSVKVGSSGEVDLYTRASTHVVVDVTGYYPTGTGYHALVPSRLLDTRTGARRPAGSTTSLTVTGHGGVPTSEVAAVVLNVTAVAPAAPGHVTVWPAGSSRPTASNVNYDKGQIVAGMVIAKVGTGGQVDLYTLATADLVVDVAGWIPVGGGYAPLVPARVLDTRAGLGAAKGKVNADGTVTVQVTGFGGVPAGGVDAVEVNVTATNPEGPGFITAYPADVARPWASTVNYARGQTVANSATLKVSSSGSITLYTLATSDVIVDVLGYYHPALGAGQAGALSTPRGERQTAR
ncbi:hypothetical protein [Leekyejoonella antrihumi]|uniref:hypothetical protein n=1 Tax=Leekyejoonella antrihumi TaxID=1660198 RepID=UPI001644EE1E|nr:hypothetical protein [Leekyejoonella antrihumi]